MISSCIQYWIVSSICQISSKSIDWQYFLVSFYVQQVVESRMEKVEKELGQEPSGG